MELKLSSKLKQKIKSIIQEDIPVEGNGPLVHSIIIPNKEIGGLKLPIVISEDEDYIREYILIMDITSLPQAEMKTAIFEIVLRLQAKSYEFIYGILPVEEKKYLVAVQSQKTSSVMRESPELKYEWRSLSFSAAAMVEELSKAFKIGRDKLIPENISI